MKRRIDHGIRVHQVVPGTTPSRLSIRLAPRGVFNRLLLSPQAMLAIRDRDALDADAGEQDVAKRPEDPAVH